MAGRPTLVTEPSTKAKLEARMQVARTQLGCCILRLAIAKRTMPVRRNQPPNSPRARSRRDDRFGARMCGVLILMGENGIFEIDRRPARRLGLAGHYLSGRRRADKGAGAVVQGHLAL